MSVTMPWQASRDAPVNGVADKLDEVRRNLSKEAEHLAEMAADYTHQAQAHAADVADDATTQASKLARSASDQASAAASEHAANAGSWFNQLIKAGAALGTAIALSGRKSAQDLGDDAQTVAKDVGGNAQTLAKELRKVRITTEPKKTGPDFAPGITLLAGFGAGIALMYFLDPERGRARRNMLRDKVASFARKASETASGTARDLSNRAQGAAHETGSQLRGQMSSDVDPSADTQSWRTGDGGEYAAGNPDGSTTDTWGTQPQRETSTI